jgi:hypothetical protein
VRREIFAIRALCGAVSETKLTWRPTAHLRFFDTERGRSYLMQWWESYNECALPTGKGEWRDVLHREFSDKAPPL